MGLRGESRIQPPPPSFVISPSSINGSSKQRRRSERRLGTAQRGCRLSKVEELIEVASPISGRELDPTLPPLVPRPTLPSNHTLPSGGGPCWTPPAAPGRRLGLLPPGRVVHLWSSQIRTWTGMFAWGRGACRACVAFLGHHLS